MKFMVLLLAFAGHVVLAKSSLDELPVHPGVGGFYKGPNSETIIKGPDGSVITAKAEGGEIFTQPAAEAPVVVSEAAAITLADSVPEVAIASEIVSTIPDVSVAASAPQVVSEEKIVQSDAVSVAANAPAVVLGPVVGDVSVPASAEHTIEIIQPDPHIIETEIVDAPIIEPQQSTDLVGPSGSISTRGSSSIISGPASTTISEPAKVLVATPIVAAVPVIASVKTPLRAIPIVEVASDIPAPKTSFVLEPKLSTVSVGLPTDTASIPPPVTVSTVSPLAAEQGIVELFHNSGSTPETWEVAHTNQAQSELSASTPAPILLPPYPAHIDLINSPPLAAVNPASSYGVVPNADGTLSLSSTVQPEVTPIVATPSPISNEEALKLPENFHSNLNYALANNRQLSINPSLISPANIIPPEIGGFSKAATDLESIVTVSSTDRSLPAPEVSNAQYSNSEAIVDNNVKVIEKKSDQVQTVPYQTHGVPITGQPGQLVNNPNNIPIPGLLPNVVPRDGLVGSGLAKYGIDSSQINLAQIPLSSIRRIAPSQLHSSLSHDVDDSSSATWNRYGRDIAKEINLGEKHNGKS